MLFPIVDKIEKFADKKAWPQRRKNRVSTHMKEKDFFLLILFSNESR